MDIAKTLITLSQSIGVSGAEHSELENSSSKTALGLLKSYTDDAYIDDFGSVIGFIGDRDNGRKTLLLDAHIDEIGLVVTYIDDDGFIKVGNVGGIDRRLLLAQTVVIHGKKAVLGVVSTLPPHIDTDSKKTPKLDDIAIDTGYTKAELEKLVSLGDSVTFQSEAMPLIGTKITGKSLDDKAGVACILYALELLKGAELAYNIAVLFSTQEEVGERGAKIAAQSIAADEALVMDVSFAKTPDSSPYKTWKLGGGVMIGYSAVLSRRMSDKLVRIANEKSIPCQIEVMPSETGTNADNIAVSGIGVKAVTLSIPLRYMHTPVEIVDTEDIVAVGRLIAEYAKEGCHE